MKTHWQAGGRPVAHESAAALAPMAPAATIGFDRPLDSSPRQLLQRRRIDALGTAARPTPSPQGAPLQRKLTLAGEKELRETNLQDLNRMLEGSEASVDVDSEGTVSFKSHPKNDELAEHEGYRLLHELIAQDKVVTVGYDSSNDKATAKAEDTEAASDPKLGSNSFLNMPKEYTSQDLVQDENGEIKEATTPRFMVMAHELIHALHYAQGLRATGGWVDYPIHGTFEGRKIKPNTTHGSREEEVNTVGLGPQKKGAITENALRKRLKMPTRPIYDSDTAGVSNRLRDWLEPTEESTEKSIKKSTQKSPPSKQPTRRLSIDLSSSSSSSQKIDFSSFLSKTKKKDKEDEEKK